MNIFVIPSWYPSYSDPIIGIFHKEFVMGMAKHQPHINIGLSLWGQTETRLQLWTKDHIKNIPKTLKALKLQASNQQHSANLKEYYTPAFTWTKKILKGNIKGITQANEINLKQFISDYGKPYLMHAQVGYPAGHIAMLLSQKYKIPYIITEQMSPFPLEDFIDAKGKMSELLYLPMKNASKIVAISPSLEKDIHSFGFEQTTVIPNLVDEDFFFPDQNLKHDKEKPFTFFTLGRMVPQKGIPILLQAIALLKEKELNIKCLIGGSGEELEAYKSLAFYLNIEESIEWLGLLDKEGARENYWKCDAFVLPSLHETMGVVLAEAMACGKPVLATKCGGPESVVNPVNGILVETNNPQALANEMEKLMKNHSNYDSMAIRKDFLRRFSTKAITEKYVRLYQEIIKVGQSFAMK